MILDAQLLFSDKQEISADGDSTNVIDLGEGTGRSMNPRLRVFCQVLNTPAGTSSPSLKAILKGSNNGTDYSTVLDSGAIGFGNLGPGVQMFKDVPYLVGESYRYYKITYDVGGTLSTNPKVTAGFIADGVPVTELTH